MADKEVFYATGRRKTSVARVYMTKGKGVFTVNISQNIRLMLILEITLS